MDSPWSFIGEMKDHAEDVVFFFTSLEGCQAYFNIPHPNAEEERVFSIVIKNQLCFRPRLNPEETLASIATVKLAMEPVSGETFNIPQEVSTATKSATFKYKLPHL